MLSISFHPHATQMALGFQKDGRKKSEKNLSQNFHTRDDDDGSPTRRCSQKKKKLIRTETADAAVRPRIERNQPHRTRCHHIQSCICGTGKMWRRDTCAQQMCFVKCVDGKQIELLTQNKPNLCVVSFCLMPPLYSKTDRRSARKVFLFACFRCVMRFGGRCGSVFVCVCRVFGWWLFVEVLYIRIRTY